MSKTSFTRKRGAPFRLSEKERSPTQNVSDAEGRGSKRCPTRTIRHSEEQLKADGTGARSQTHSREDRFEPPQFRGFVSTLDLGPACATSSRRIGGGFYRSCVSANDP